MSAFNSHTAYTNAVAVVVAALQSGAIKLNGPDSTYPANAKLDSDYLNEVINSLAANMKAK